MSVKPIDLQTNISQMHEVGRNEHARSASVAEQQQYLDKESQDKANLVNSRLDETKKGEKTAIRDEKKEKRKKGDSGSRDVKKKPESDTAESVRKPVRDDRMGKFIDVLK